MANLWSRFAELSDTGPLLMGTVTAHRDDGSNTSIIRLPGGGTLIAVGQSVPVGQRAFVRDGVIEGPAPTLPSIEIEI